MGNDPINLIYRIWGSAGRSNAPANGAVSASASSDQAEEYAPDEVVVKFRSSDEMGKIELFRQRHSLAHIENLFHNSSPGPLNNIHRFRLGSGADIHKLIEEMRQDPNIEYAQPNYKRWPADTIPNDVLFSQQWALTRIGAPQAWDMGTGDPNLIVAIVDSGVDYNHPDLAARLSGGQAFLVSGTSSDVMDNLGHGTSVAGIIGAATNNTFGVAGINWHSKIMPVKFDFYDTTGAQAIQYAADNGARVINLSWGGYFYSPVLKDAVDYAYGKGCVLVGATGNEGVDFPFYPTAFKKVISVGASNRNDDISIWSEQQSSNFAGWLNLSAPGSDVLSTILGNGYDNFQGTSAAAPHVSAVASLVSSAYPDLSNEEIRQVLFKSADDRGDAGWDKYYGYGILNLFQALTIPASYLPSSALITYPEADQFITSLAAIEIKGTAAGRNFSQYVIEYGEGDEPVVWNNSQISLRNNGSSQVNEDVLATFDPSVLQSNLVTLRLRTTNTQGDRSEDRTSFYFDNMLKFNRSYQVDSATKIIGADLDRDGNTEIILNAAQLLTVFDAQGNEKPGWPKMDGGMKFSGAAVGDIDNDGELEIIAAASTENYMGRMYVWKLNGDPVAGWPKDIPEISESELFTGTAIAADINDDGKLEIIASTNQGKIFILDNSGNYLPGWPKQFNSGVLGLAIIDVDGNKRLVIAAGNQAQMVNGQGTAEPGWPKTLDFQAASVVVADIDGDGKQEVVVAGNLDETTQKMVAFDRAGNIKPGWPVTFSGSNRSIPALSAGDIDNDGKVEIMVNSYEYDLSALRCISGNVRVFDHSGSIKPGWPKQNAHDCSVNNVILGDLNGDGANDLIYPSLSKKVQAWNGDGSPASNWPRYTRATNFGLAVFDIDGNGKNEVLTAVVTPDPAQSELYVWESTAAGQTASHWPMHRHDSYNSGNYNYDLVPPVIEHDPISTAQNGRPITLFAQITDNVMVRTARVFYKAMSSPTYQFVMMNNPSGSQWSGEVPAAAVKMEGLRYYFVAHDSAINPAVSPVYDLTVVEALPDNNPPTISFDPITEGLAGIEQLLTADVIDDLSGVKSVWLAYRHKKYGEKKVESQKREGDYYSAYIPAGDMLEGEITYSLGARDNSGNEIQTATYSLQVIKHQKSYGCGCN